MWRRSTGLALAGVGAFALTAAVTAAFLFPSLIAIPLAETVRSTSRGSGLTVLSAAEMAQRTDVDVVARRIVTGNPTAPEAGPHTAVWTTGVVLTDAAGALLATDELTFCLDRRTGAATRPCPSARHNGAVGIAVSGQVLQFPLGTGRLDYELFDPATGRAWPVLFDDVDYVGELEVNRFVQEVPATVIDRQEVPGELTGAPAGSAVPVDVVYSSTRTVWVEPRTGAIVKMVEEPLRYLRAVDGDPVAVLLFGSIGTDGPTVAENVLRAADGRTQLLLFEVYGPLLLGLSGLVAVLAGLTVVHRDHRRMRRYVAVRRPERPVPGR